MTLLSFASILLLLLLIAEKVLLAPTAFLANFHLPAWMSLMVVVGLLSWLIGE